jgi:hypothetical protein
LVFKGTGTGEVYSVFLETDFDLIPCDPFGGISCIRWIYNEMIEEHIKQEADVIIHPSCQ